MTRFASKTCGIAAENGLTADAGAIVFSGDNAGLPNTTLCY